MAAYRKRHNLQQQSEDASCRSSLAATADEASEPPSKFFKADSPGEADQQSAALDFSLQNANRVLPLIVGDEANAVIVDDCPIEHIPDELLITVFIYFLYLFFNYFSSIIF